MKTSLWVGVFAFSAVLTSGADEVEPQPFLAATQRLIEATDYLGTPFSDAERATLKACITTNDAASVAKAQTLLDAHALFHVTIKPAGGSTSSVWTTKRA